MATFFQTVDRTSTLDNTTLFSLASGDELFVGRDATLATSGDNSRPVSATDNTRMIINGELFGASTAIQTSGDNNSIGIGAEGSVAAAGTAIALSGAGDTVSNAGEILGTARGLLSLGDTTLTNTGLISGATGVQIVAGQNQIVNHGTIKSEFQGNSALLIAGGGNDIDNTGTISAVEGPAIEFSGGAGFGNTVFNSGTILTAEGSGQFGRDAIEFADADDELVNTGLIAGEVDFGLGDDRLDTRQGTITGDVFGDDGDDTMLGSAVDDDFAGGDDDDQLSGFAGDDELSGGNGNDVLNGGLGVDALDGDAGSDVASYAHAAGAVRAFLSAPNQNTGEAAGDSYTEIEGLLGSRFADVLAGTSGADVLNGGAGADTLSGGAGDDSYGVDSAADKINESAAASGGVDTVRATFSTTLGAGLENLELGANAFSNEDLNGTGNAANNRIGGSNGDNLLSGGLGQDTLIGRGGADSFVFNTALSAANVDIVDDFNVAADTIRIDNAVFTGLAQGALAAGAFAVGAAATQADDRIIYNNATGALTFDANGSGAGGATQFATLDPGLALTAADILVV